MPWTTGKSDGLRQGKTVGGGTPINYLWDSESGLPLLVDDGSTGYVHADGLLENISGSTDTHYLGDALGSVRGLTDGSGNLAATADYDVFGALRGGAGTGTFGFTGEQFDAETGYTYLRARYYDPALGRFVSADSVQPNAPGTQGYNLYAYVANNPTTWVDPTGNSAQTLALTLVSSGLLPWVSGIPVSTSTLVLIVPVLVVAIAILVCYFWSECREAVARYADDVAGSGPWAGGGSGEAVAPTTGGGAGGTSGTTTGGGGSGGAGVVLEQPIAQVVAGVDFGGFPPRKGPGGEPPDQRKICLAGC